MNLAVQEILKYIKAEDAQDEDVILDDILNDTNTYSNKIIPKVKTKKNNWIVNRILLDKYLIYKTTTNKTIIY